MELWSMWLFIAGILMIVEFFTQTLWCLCLTVSCLVAMIFALCGMSVDGQIISLGVTALLSGLLLMPIFKRQRRLQSQPDTSDSRTGMDALLGRKAIITEEIRPGRLGRARIDGDNWQVRAQGTQGVIARGCEVEVTGYDSIILDVKPLQ